MHFDPTDWNTVALEVVRTLHPIPVYSEPQLKKAMSYKAQDAYKLNKPAVKETKRRKDIQLISEELSRYYQLPQGWWGWGCSSLLEEGKHVTPIRR